MTARHHIRFPACPFCCGWCCADCRYMSITDVNRHGLARCMARGQYLDPADRICCYFLRR